MASAWEVTALIRGVKPEFWDGGHVGSLYRAQCFECGTLVLVRVLQRQGPRISPMQVNRDQYG